MQWTAPSNYLEARLKTLVDCLPVPTGFRVPQELLPRSRAAGCLVNDVASCGRMQKLLMGAALCSTSSRSQVSSTMREIPILYSILLSYTLSLSYDVIVILSLDLFLGRE